MGTIRFTATCMMMKFLPAQPGDSLSFAYVYDFRAEQGSPISSSFQLAGKSPTEFQVGARYEMSLGVARVQDPEGTWFPNSEPTNKLPYYSGPGDYKRHVGCDGLIHQEAEGNKRVMRCARCRATGELVKQGEA